jgi:hypothetical protein
MHQRSPQLDWQVCQTDKEWEALSQTDQPLVPRPRSPIRRFLPYGLCLFLLLAASGLRWYSVLAERAAVAAALAQTVDAEAQADAPSLNPLITSQATPGRAISELATVGLKSQELTALAQSPPDGSAVTRLRRLDGDVAVAEVALPGSQDQPALRQTRVYRQSESGWVRMAPSAAHWGAPFQWEAEHLVFHYYADDILAVAPVAAPLDARYAELHQLFLGEAPSHPLTVIVDPAQAPGQIASRASSADPLVVASPAVYLAPMSISDAELLAQSVVLALLGDLTAQARLPYANASNDPDYVRWIRVGQLLEGVTLWQVWQGDLPLARWREPVVQWVFSDERRWQPELGEVVPHFWAELCAMHRLWITTPLALRIPLVCDNAWDSPTRYLVWRLAYTPPLRLAQFPLLTQAMLMQGYPMGHPAATVALATVLEYAAATYGPERISLLVEEVSEHEYWATLIPAVFGVSADEFETGWQAYLAQQYNLTSLPAD